MPTESLAQAFPPSSASERRSGLPLGLLLVLCFYFVAIPIIAGNVGARSRAAWDQNSFHLPVIRQFIDQWPHVDLTDYASSTTPGYHVAVAAMARALGSGTTALRFYGSLFTAGLLGLLGWHVGRHMRFLEALIVCLPLAGSIYVISSGAFLLPDNIGWLGVLCVMLIALRPRTDRWTFIAAGLLLLTTVLIRQIHAWLIAPLLVAMLFEENDGGTPVSFSSTAGESGAPVASSRSLRLMWMSLVILPTLFILLWFQHLWHGSLVPPNQRVLTSGFAPSAPAIILAISGIVCVFYSGLLIPHLKSRRSLAWGAAVGAIIGALPHTTYDLAARRFSGIWNAVPHFPYLMHRSPLIVALAALGGAGISVWLSALPRRQGWIWAAAGGAFAIAHTANVNIFERHYEPFILLAAAMTAPVLLARMPQRPRWSYLTGPLMLALLCAAVTAASLR